MRTTSRFLVVALVAACGGGGGGGTPDALVLVDAAATPDAAAEPDAAPQGDGNDDFADAVDLTIGDMIGASEVIQAPRDRDYYKFSATAGQWLYVATEANPMDDPDMLDTVIRMFGPDSTTTMVAENDDGVPRVNTDSEIIIRIPATGVYHLEILDYTDWTGTGIPEFGPTYTYTIRVLDATTALMNDLEPMTDPGDLAINARPVTPPLAILSKFDTATDIDVYSVTLAAQSFFEVSAMPDGPTGYGGTADVGNLWVTDATGATIIGRVNAAMGPFMGPFQVSPPLAAGTYLVFAERQTGAAGANDFWVGKVFTSAMDNPKELETVPGTNDTVGTAETVTMSPSGTAFQGFLLSDLTTTVDVDVFGFNVPASQNVSFFCASARNGSGVQGLSGELRRADDSIVTSGTENLTDGLVRTNVAVGAAGTYYLRLAKTGQDAAVTGTWVRCGIITFPAM